MLLESQQTLKNQSVIKCEFHLKPIGGITIKDERKSPYQIQMIVC